MINIPTVEEIMKNMAVIKDKGTRPNVRHTRYIYDFGDTSKKWRTYRADVITVVRKKTFFNDVKLNLYHQNDINRVPINHSEFEKICEWGTYDIFSLQEDIAKDIREHIKSTTKSTVLEES